MSIWEAVGYRPNPEQLAAHVHSARMKLIAGGERAGKSYSAAMELVSKCDEPEGLFWIVGPSYALARAEFGYVVEALAKVGALHGKPSWPAQGSCSCETLWRAEVVTKSADDPVKLAGEAPHGVLLCEAAQCTYEAWLRLRGRVAEKRGWLWASGTFEGSMGWYAETWQRWQGENAESGRSFSLPSWSNLSLYPGGREDPEIRSLAATYPADLFQERFGAVPCPPADLVFREFSYREHVSADVVYDRDSAVELAVDPGYAGAYAVLAVQRDGWAVNVIDEVYHRGVVAQDVIRECQGRAWWGGVTGGVIDIAGRQHAGLPSHVEVWQKEAGVWLRANRVGVVDGITRLRTFLRDPGRGGARVRFSPSCKETCGEFGKYRYGTVAAHRPVREEPLDRDNHALKALSYWLYDRFGPVGKETRLPTAGRDPFRQAEPLGDTTLVRQWEPREGVLVPGKLRFGRKVKLSGVRKLAFGR